MKKKRKAVRSLTQKQLDTNKLTILRTKSTRTNA